MRWLTAIGMLLTLSVSGQDWQIRSVGGINTEADEILCTLIDGQVIIARNDHPGWVTDVGIGDDAFRLLYAQKQNTYDSLLVDGGIFRDGAADVGSACYHQADSTLWFSAGIDPDGRMRETLGIFWCKKEKDGWGEVLQFDWNSDHNLAHPWVDDKGDRLFFSSDRPGGKGGMDIWFCNRLDSSWSAPIPMFELNSEGNDIFPTYHEGAIYFSSDRTGQLDLYRSDRASQWTNCLALEAPFNSPGDDLQLVFIDNDKAFLTSNRAGSDDIYTLSAPSDRELLAGVHGLIECLGMPVQGVVVNIWNTRGELLVSENSSPSGEFSLDQLEVGGHYRVQVKGLPVEAYPKSYVYFVDDLGTRLRVFRLNANGEFEFEFLPGDLLGGFDRMANEDQSVLSIPLSGQVYENTPGDVGGGEAVYILDDEGELLALSYTSDKGRFQVPELRPIADYTFRLDPQGRELHVLIQDGDEEREITMVDGEGTYHRMDAEEGIRLVDENRNPMVIRQDEVFIIRNIFYSFDSINLNPVAQQQLTQLSAILRANPDIKLELSSHTDSRGTLEYNDELSRRRAQAARAFLLGKGVAGERIKAIGFGERKLTNHCADGVECTEELHALNRRTEIRILAE